MISEAAVITNEFSRGTPCTLPPESDDRVAELAGVDVERPRPRDGRDVDPERVPVVDRRVQRRGEEVVGGRDRVEVAVEVEVDVLHRHDLRVPPARTRRP